MRDFSVLFYGKLLVNGCRAKLPELITWHGLEHDYAPKFCSACGTNLLSAGKLWSRKLLVVGELVRQQEILHDSSIRSIPHRIVSLTRPHLRPIVQGQAQSNRELGVKVSISDTGEVIAFLDRLGWVPSNQGEDLKT